MLRALSVKNYVLIDSLEIDFPEGLIIITGQTGAGKSILLGALSLLLGAKADASVISEGAQSCVVEAEFELDSSDAVKSLFEENDVECDDGHIVIRRVISTTGRSRSYVNDSPVSVQLLSRISSKLVDIHSQHQSLLLTDKSFQLSILDFFAGDSSLLSSYRAVWTECQHLQKDVSDLDARLEKLDAEKEYNSAQFRQLDTASLKEGELEELEAEQRQLANAEEIKNMLSQIENAVSPLGDDVPSMDIGLRSICQLLEKVSKFIPQAGALKERVSSVRIELSDIMDEVCSLNSGISLSEERLSFVEERMSVLYSLMKKHSCSSVKELIAVRDRFGGTVSDSESLALRRNELAVELSSKEKLLMELSAELHSAREQAIGGFVSAIVSSLRFLELDRASFDVLLEETALSPTGSDSVTFLFSASGRVPMDISRCASGGELSRIMLSLKALMAKYTDMPTMIFDEIDTGVSGSVADKMGSMICEMGHDMQVFAITHLPQVAAKGSAHYLVTKEYDASGRSVTSIQRLAKDARIMEVARMLSGSSITDAAIANAESLLS